MNRSVFLSCLLAFLILFPAGCKRQKEVAKTVAVPHISSVKDSSSQTDYSNDSPYTDTSSNLDTSNSSDNSVSEDAFSDNTDALVAGHVGIIVNNSGDKGAPAANTKEDFNEMVKYANAHDMEGWAQMTYQGRMVMLPVGTRIRIISNGWYCRIRVLDGNYAGEEFYISDVFIR